ncbi:MAG: aldehyde ferredoxin oxidoreductase family protein [Anaerolineae bacterium]
MIANLLAQINLTTDQIQLSPTPEHLIRGFLGGRGLNVYYLHKLLPAGIDPLGPENPLIVGTGLLTGTAAPSASRCNFTAKSPESGILGDANMGGFFGAELRFAGFDRLIISGRAERPVYLYLADGAVEVRQANHLWGLTVSQTQQCLREELGRDIEVACIGPAGEKLVRFAAVVNGLKNTAARGGLGAVMGSKNLKAIVAQGTMDIPLADPARFWQQCLEFRDYLLTSKWIQTLGQVGTSILYDVSNVLGTVRTKNSQLNAFDGSLLTTEFEKHSEKMLSCHACAVHCRHRNDQGGEGPDYSTFGALGANCGVSGAAQSIQLNNICNDLGLDASSAGTIISWAIELYEQGIISPRETGRELRFGHFELVRDLLFDVAERRGFGHTLAESSQAVQRFGPRSHDYLLAIKGLPQSDTHDVRYLKSFALGIAVASRGADHLRNRPTLEILGLPAEVMDRIYGQHIDPDPTSYQTKEHLVYYHENIYAVIDCLGLCKFICHGFNSPHMLDYQHFAALIESATGLRFTGDELRQIGCRVVDLERVILAREGISAEDDTLPRRFFEEPAPLNVARGERIDREEFEALVQRYHTLRGWGADGLPTPERVRELEGW